MLRFWMLRKLDATVLDALIATRVTRLNHNSYIGIVTFCGPDLDLEVFLA